MTCDMRMAKGWRYGIEGWGIGIRNKGVWGGGNVGYWDMNMENMGMRSWFGKWGYGKTWDGIGFGNSDIGNMGIEWGC